MNRSLSALILTGSLVMCGSAWADPPHGKGNKNGKLEKKQEKAEDKAEKREDKAERKDGYQYRFTNLDLNHDGRISRSEWHGDDASFRANDWNRDGVLSGDELRADLRRPDQFMRRDWKGDLREFDKADTNHDGVLTAAEFARWR
jgi:hypothetical protein